MSPHPDTGQETAPIVVTLDPRVAYAGFGPDDGDLGATAAALDVTDAVEDLADAAEHLDFAYRSAWAAAAERIAPGARWEVRAPHHEHPDDRPVSGRVATVDRSDLVGTDLLDTVTAALTVQVDTADPARTRWIVTDEGRRSGSASVPWTVRSVQDRHVRDVAARIADNGELLRDVACDGLALRLYAPTGELPADRDAIGYVLTDRDAVVFAGLDFHPSPLHAVDSDATVEALAGFLSLRAGDTDREYFAGYTVAQLEWIDGDGPDRLQELVHTPADQPDRPSGAGTQDGQVRMWSVTPTGRPDLPTVRLLADGPDSARAQYPGYVAAWLADTGRDAAVDDDLFPPLAVEEAPTPGDRPLTVTPVHGGHGLDWAVEHINYWDRAVTIPVDNLPDDPVLDIPDTGLAIVAVRNATAIAHAGAVVEAFRRARVTALDGSHVVIHPGASVDRRPGSTIRLERTPHRSEPQRDRGQHLRSEHVERGR